MEQETPPARSRSTFRQAFQDEQPSNSEAQHEAIEKTALDVVTAYFVNARGELIRESLDPRPPPAAAANAGAIQAAFEAVGVEFTNGEQLGVRLKAK